MIRDLEKKIVNRRGRTAELARDRDFRATFHVCHLPFAVFKAVRRSVFAFFKNVSIYLKSLSFSATIMGLCSSQVKFHLLFYVKSPVNCQRLHKKEEKMR